jgi:hypothetical protein
MPRSRENQSTKLWTISVLLFLSNSIPTAKTLSTQETGVSRRTFLQSIPALIGSSVAFFIQLPPTSSNAAETIGKDQNCNEASCLGIWDGLLADCPHGKVVMNSGSGCASSQDDTPGVFAEPWDYSEANSLDYNDQMRVLLPAIQLVCSKRGDQVQVIQQEARYLRVLFKDGKTGEESSGEFYFTESDSTVQFRVGSLNPSSSSLISSSTKNLERCEMIRKQLRYTKLPVLRNRKRALFFAESDFDSFGPGSASLGPPAEMTTGELEGRQDVDPRLKIDALQNFPFGGTIGGRPR